MLQVLNETVPIPELPNKVEGVTWDSNIMDRNTFIVFDNHEIFTYIYINHSTEGKIILCNRDITITDI